MQDTIAIVFDFDETLAPDSTSGFLESIGIDVPAFWKNEVDPLWKDGWDPVPAYLYKMIEVSDRGAPLITSSALSDWGGRLPLYPGADSVFERLVAHSASVQPNIRIEFYLISSGLAEILHSTSVAKYFKDIWACEFHTRTNGGIAYPKRVVSFTDKTRYLFHIAKGLIGAAYRGQPFEVNRKIPDAQLRVPLDQMIFVGDGYTDIPCFSLIRKAHGTAIGVYDKEDRARWGRAWGFVEDGRVSNLVPADYRSGSALSNSLEMAITSTAARIGLKNRTYQG